MDNNLGEDLKNIFGSIEKFVNKAKNAEGMNLTEEQKKEFKEKFEREGGNDLLKKLQEEKEKLFKR